MEDDYAVYGEAVLEQRKTDFNHQPVLIANNLGCKYGLGFASVTVDTV